MMVCVVLKLGKNELFLDIFARFYLMTTILTDT